MSMRKVRPGSSHRPVLRPSLLLVVSVVEIQPVSQSHTSGTKDPRTLSFDRGGGVSGVGGSGSEDPSVLSDPVHSRKSLEDVPGPVRRARW